MTLRYEIFIGIELSDFHCKSGHANRCGCLVSKITDPVVCECLSLNLEESKKVLKKQYERKDQYVTFLKKNKRARGSRS